MSKPDLNTVLARRAEVANELAVLDKMRRDMEAEDEDLVVAERVMKRLAGVPSTEAPQTLASDVTEEQQPLGA